MPIGSLLEKFRSRAQAEIELARERAGLEPVLDVIAPVEADEHPGPLPVP